MTEPTAVTARVGQRGRLVLPAQAQRAARITEGDLVAVRTTDGAITIEPLWAVRDQLRTTFAPLLAGHLPAGPALMLTGGHPLPDHDENSDQPPAELRPLPGDTRGVRVLAGGEQRVVVTARAVLAWIAAGPDSRVSHWLDRAILPEAAVADLVTVLARAGAHERADHLLAELTLLGVRQPRPAEHRAALATDTAHALDLTTRAAAAAIELTMPDALCAAAAHRLALPLLAADLLPTETP
ncbi:AbrB/MazE/SpoVT family DNA-binding domain-containing protein [Kitasatospora sp. NPDC059973]|uniref:AbrB/MazE/SpoVT family DNA-binding domain-containing protein n=1 Tax=Kitasatospora sp. NPDC059973 TaxID=3347020 RepID=UPI0036A5D130